MIYLIGVIALLCAALWWYIRRLAEALKEITALKKTEANLRGAIQGRDNAIRKLQEAYHEAAEKKGSIRSGDPDADFRRALDLLRDVPTEPDAD